MLTFLNGLIMGIIVSTSPGPMLTILLKEGVRRGYSFAFRFGMGIAVLDIIYCLLAFLGISPLIKSYPTFIPFMWLVAGLVFLVMGIRDIYSMAKSHGHIEEPEKYKKLDFNHPFIQGLLVSIFNPGALLFWIGVSAAYSHLGGVSSVLFVAGVSLGSPIWFFILAHIIAHIRESMSEKFLYYFTLFAGIILIGASFYAFFKFSRIYV